MIRRVLTSRDFVAKAGIEDMIEAFDEEGIEILWTEDLKAAIGIKQKIAALVAARRVSDVKLSSDQPAAVLFTSGTEGSPKGVVLSHANLLANVAQLRARTDVSPADRVICALPMFHSFGLTGGLLLPLLAGAKVTIYPSPLHYRVIPELVYNEQATLIFGTDTFLSGWGRRASSYDFSTLRAAIAGAESVKDATRKMWSDRFGVRILEGYGATEAGPVVALNTPIEQSHGSVGRLLPGIDYRLEAVPGVEGSRLWIKGPNIMSGYFMPSEPGVLQPPVEGWYDTGDIVQIAEDGFVTICGRVKRFAKVGGEMVSLGAVEVLASEVWPDVPLAAISIPDARKGERVLLLIEGVECVRADLIKAAKARGISEILLPAEVAHVAKIPMLASGKTNYPELASMVLQERQVAA
jgi:acyl-[acyl-carrier-protein]-phospholipid O-acyltransferase/long-chain-fatty-acid--[acyl-carrier-protein] ligase